MREGKPIIFVFQLIRLPIQRTSRPSKKPKRFPGGRHGPAAAVRHRRLVSLSRDARDPHARGGIDLLSASRGIRGQFLPALPPLLRKPAAHHPDLLQAAGTVALRSRPSRLGRRRRARPRLSPARDGLARARHRGAARGSDRPPARQHARSQPSALAVLRHHRPRERPGRSLFEGPSRRDRRRRRHGDQQGAVRRDGGAARGGAAAAKTRLIQTGAQCRQPPSIR